MSAHQTEREMLLTLLYEHNYVVTFNRTTKRYIAATDSWRSESIDFNECIKTAYKYSVTDAPPPSV